MKKIKLGLGALGLSLLSQPALATGGVQGGRFINLKALFIGAVIMAVIIQVLQVKAQKQRIEKEAKEEALLEKMRNTSLVVIDAQNDFIDGALATENGLEALAAIISYMDANPELKAYYTLDWHSPENKSFKENGGTWPVHCVRETDGAELHRAFYNVNSPAQRPSEANMFYKGLDDEVEEYSGFAAQAKNGDYLHEIIRSHVILCGFASEYCVKETAMTLIEAGYTVELLTDGVGYVDRDEHIETILDLENIGVTLL